MSKDVRPEKKKIDFVSLVLTVLIIAVAIAGINCYIEQYEKNYRGEVLNRELKEVINENDRLVIEYQRKTNYLTVEDYVSEKLGMKKISNYQIEYIDRDRLNTVELSGENDSEGGFAEDITKVFSVIFEYFR